MEKMETIQELLKSESLEDVQQGLKVWKEHFTSDLNTFTKSALVLGSVYRRPYQQHISLWIAHQYEIFEEGRTTTLALGHE